MPNQLSYYIQQLVSCSDEELNKITDLFRRIDLKKGDFFLEAGKICRQVGFIEKGLVRYFILQNGEEKTYAFGSEGDFVSNYESLLPQTPSTAAIQCLEDSILQVIPQDRLQKLYDDLLLGNKIGRLIIERVFMETLRDLHSFYTNKPQERYINFLTKHRDLEQRISQYHIASYVGIKPQSLSRIRRRIVDRKK